MCGTAPYGGPGTVVNVINPTWSGEVKRLGMLHAICSIPYHHVLQPQLNGDLTGLNLRHDNDFDNDNNDATPPNAPPGENSRVRSLFTFEGYVPYLTMSDAFRVLSGTTFRQQDFLVGS